MQLKGTLPALLALLIWASSTSAWSKKNDAVKLSKVKTLTLRDGAETAHRRVKPIPQLSCIGGNAKGLYSVDVMRCTNSGAEYGDEDIQWTCKASLPTEFKLGSTDVICEGYDNPDDPYILKGSCGVEYRLILTPAGEEKYRDQLSQGFWGKSRGSKSSTTDGDKDTIPALIFWAFFLFVLGVIVWSVWSNYQPQNGRRQAYRRGGGGGGFDDGTDDPPPPYSPRAPPKPKTYRSNQSASSSRSSSARGSGSNEQWRPGFWTGTAAGAAAGWGASQWTNRNRTQQAQAGPSNWLGGGRTNTYQAPQPEPSGWFGGGGNRSPTYGSPSSPAPSSSRHESTGFGGTRRR